MDLRFALRRSERSGIGSRVIRFQGALLTADEEMAVYLTPKPGLVFYQDPKYGGDGRYWFFRSLAEAALEQAANGEPQFSHRLLQLVAEGLNRRDAADHAVASLQPH